MVNPELNSRWQLKANSPGAGTIGLYIQAQELTQTDAIERGHERWGSALAGETDQDAGEKQARPKHNKRGSDLEPDAGTEDWIANAP